MSVACSLLLRFSDQGGIELIRLFVYQEIAVILIKSIPMQAIFASVRQLEMFWSGAYPEARRVAPGAASAPRSPGPPHHVIGPAQPLALSARPSAAEAPQRAVLLIGRCSELRHPRARLRRDGAGGCY